MASREAMHSLPRCPRRLRGRAAIALLLLALSVSAGETHAHGSQRGGTQRARAPLGRSIIESTEPWVEPISWKPRAFVYHNFLSAQEADHIKEMARPYVKRSTVVGGHGDSVLDNIRTSYGTFLQRRQDPVMAAVEERVARWTHLNISHQEDTQVLRYGLGQKYGAHYDSLDDDSPRVATVLMYLTQPEEGGETAFPMGSEWIDPSVEARLGPFSDCARGHVAGRLKKGDAIVFWSLKPDGRSSDPAAMHTGCPVIKGVKWVAIKWIHTKPFRPEWLGQTLPAQPLPEDCADREASCADWAAKGECTSNKKFMVGDSFSLGACRAACGDCEVCAAGDIPCKNRNREKAGYLSLEELA